MDEKTQIAEGVAPPPYPANNQSGYAPNPPPGYQQAPPPGPTGAYPVGQNMPPPPSYPYQGPPSGYAPVPPQPVVGTTVVVQHQFGMIPASCTCPNCHQNVVTRTEYETGLFTWLLVGIIFLCGGWIFCLCLLPFCIDSLKDVRHICPNCNHAIYYHKRM